MPDRAPDNKGYESYDMGGDERGQASGYSVFYNAENLTWDWTAYYNGNSRNGSSIAKLDAEWAARDAWDRMDRDPHAL